MSHFTVMVLGNNPEEQLARYEEDTSDLRREWLTFKNLEEEYRLKYKTDKKYVENIYYNYITIKPEDMDNLEHGDADITITNVLDSSMIDINNYKYYHVCTRVPKDHRKMIIEVNSINKLSRDNVIIHATKAEVAEVVVNDIMSWDNYMTEYCGYKFDEEQSAYGYWTNEKAKWDWYQLGGRWNGYFKLKPILSLPPALSEMVESLGFTFNEINKFVNLKNNSNDAYNKLLAKYQGKGKQIDDIVSQLIDNRVQYFTGVIGDAGVFGDSRKDFTGRADQATKGNIDIEAMQSEEANIARKRYQTVLRCFNGIIPKIDISWSVFTADNGLYKDMDWDDRREKYHSQPALKQLAEIKDAINNGIINIDEEYKHLFSLIDLEDYNCTEDEYAKRAANNAISTFALVKDGEWYEKGEMGWWACVSNEMNQDEWNLKVNEMFNELPDDTLVSIFDCHI